LLRTIMLISDPGSCDRPDLVKKMDLLRNLDL
jgi:hypothetical protein